MINILKKLVPWADWNNKIFNLYKKSYYYSSKFNQISRMFNYTIRKKYNSFISPKAILKGVINFPHPIGIVIGEGVKIGKNVTIYQNVTLGRKNKDIAEYPTIGDNVTIYCNSTIIGNVKIGNNAVIGCNSVVLRDVKDGEVVSGIVK